MRPQNYSDYTIAELREALSTVDGVNYPENKAALEAELQKRVDSGEVEREREAKARSDHEKEQGHRRFARSSRKWIGLYLMGAPLILLSAGVQLQAGPVWAAYAVYGLCAIYTGVSVVAGFGLWKLKEWGRRLAIGVFALQAVSFQTSFMVYGLTSALAGFFYIDYVPGNFQFGVSAYITTGGFQFSIGNLPQPFTLALNLAAVFLIWLLIKARQPLDGEESGINTRPEGWTS